MTTTIDAVTFDKDPIWIDELKYIDLRAKNYTAVDGTLNSFQVAKGAHYPITLVGKQKTGWLKGSTIVSLKALSAAVGATYTLTLNSDTYTVFFDNSNGPAISMGFAMGDTTAPDSDTYYFGTIKLICTGE